LLRSLLEDHLEPGYEVAAARHAAQSATPRARRLSAAARSVVLLTIGLLVAVAYQQASVAAPQAAQTRAALAADARARAALTDRLQHQADTERSRLSAERARALADTAAGRQLAGRLHSLEVGTSLIALTGPGLVVTVADAPVRPDPVTGQAPPVDPTGAGRIQDRDLAAVVNGLWAAGAEAVSVDGQRLSPLSTIRSAGGAILVDFRPVSSPYELHAVGDAGRMQSRFADSAVARSLATLNQLYGITLTVHTKAAVDVPAAPVTQLRYALPRATGQ
jgi:uncharacterized protein YlxW (UPF0749 family)